MRQSTFKSGCPLGTIAAAATLMIVILASGGIGRAQVRGQADLDWQQRFLGILPLVKPDPKDPVVVTVNGKPITAAEINSYSKTEARMINATSTEETQAVWKDATENLIGRELLLQEANRRKITIPEGELAQRAREFQVSGPGGQSVSAGGGPDQQLLDEVRGSMQIEKMLDDEFRTRHVQPTESDIRQYYEEHKDLFIKDPGEAEISHIAVKLPPDATDAQKASLEKKVRQIYADAEKTKDFASLAKKSSEDDKSAAKGGKLGFFRPGQLPPTVDKLVFSTPVGHLTPIIESNMGYSFIRVDSRRGTQYQSLAEAKPKIAMVLLDYNQNAVVKSILKQLSKKATIDFKKPTGRA